MLAVRLAPERVHEFVAKLLGDDVHALGRARRDRPHAHDALVASAPSLPAPEKLLANDLIARIEAAIRPYY